MLDPFAIVPRERKNLGSFTGSTLPAQIINSRESWRPAAAGTDLEQAVLTGYQASSIVFACLSLLWKMVSSVPWRVMRRKGRDWEAVDGHDLEILVEYPNAVMTRQRLMAMMTLHLGLCGNSLLKKIQTGGSVRAKTSELWLLNPATTRPHLGAGFVVDHYASREGQQPIRIPAELVIHAQFPNPLDPTWGLAPYASIASVVEMDRQQVAWNANLVRNKAVPSGVWKSKLKMLQPQIDYVRDRIRQMTGAVRAGEPMVLDADADWIPMERTATELDWMASRRFTVVEVVGAFGLQQALFTAEAQTYDNLSAAMRFAWENGAVSFLEVIQDALNLSLVPVRERRDTFLHYDLSGVPAMKDAIGKRLESHERAIRTGVPINRSFILNDLPVQSVEGGDVPMVAAGLITVEDAAMGGLGGDLLAPSPLDAVEKPDDVAVAAAAAESGQDVQVAESLVLNGAQIQAAAGIVEAVALGRLPRDAGLGMLAILFNLDDQQAASIMGSAGTSTPTTPNPNPAAQAAEAVAAKSAAVGAMLKMVRRSAA